MPNESRADTDAMAAFRADFPGWRVWRTPTVWWATRLGTGSVEPQTLAADSAAALRTELSSTGAATPR